MKNRPENRHTQTIVSNRHLRMQAKHTLIELSLFSNDISFIKLIVKAMETNKFINK